MRKNNPYALAAGQSTPPFLKKTITVERLKEQTMNNEHEHFFCFTCEKKTGETQVDLLFKLYRLLLHQTWPYLDIFSYIR